MIRRAGGFTLVEVMVALAVVAITLGAGIKAAGALAGNAERARQVSAAQWCAENQLVGLRLAGRFPDVGTGDFACDQLGRSYRGTMTVRASFNPNFRIVETRVADDTGVPLVSVQTIAGRY